MIELMYFSKSANSSGVGLMSARAFERQALARARAPCRRESVRARTHRKTGHIGMSSRRLELLRLGGVSGGQSLIFVVKAREGGKRSTMANILNFSSSGRRLSRR